MDYRTTTPEFLIDRLTFLSKYPADALLRLTGETFEHGNAVYDVVLEPMVNNNYEIRIYVDTDQRRLEYKEMYHIPSTR